MWAATFAATKVAVSHTGPITLSFWVFLLATLVLCPFYLYERQRLRRVSRSLRTSKSHRGWLQFSLLSLLGILPPSVLLAWGLDRSLAVNGAVLSLLIPVQMALLATILFGERMNWVRWVSFAISIVGVLVISDFNWKTVGFFHGNYLFGNALIFVANLGSSYYNTYAKKLLTAYTPVQVAFYGYVLSLLFVGMLLLLFEPTGLSSFITFGWSTWVSIGLLGVFSWGLGVPLFFYLLDRFEVTQLSVSIYLLPVFAVLISSVTLKEKITIPMLVGGILVLLGTGLVTTRGSYTSVEAK